MLANLKLVQSSLHSQESMEEFFKKHSMHEVIKFLNKAKKQETKQRIKYLFSKVSECFMYKEYLMTALDQKPQVRADFLEYLKSENSEEFYIMLQKKQEDVISLVEFNPEIIPLLFKIVSFEHGIKTVRLFKNLYEGYAKKYKILLSEEIKQELIRGIGLESLEDKNFAETVDTVAQMRFVEIIANIGLAGGECYNFIQPVLDKALNLYATEDILLKMNLTQIVSTLGEGYETSILLRDHRVWKMIEKDATNPDEEFYVKKYLLILLVGMGNQGHYEMPQKICKDLLGFIRENIALKGEYKEGALELIDNLFKSFKGTQMVVQNSEIFNHYILNSRSTEDSIKKVYLDTLASLTHTSETKGAKSNKHGLVINVLNCIGSPSLCTGLSHNLHSNTIMIEGIDEFSKWFTTYLNLPFAELESKLISIFINLLDYLEVVQVVFQKQEANKYLLRPLTANNSDKKIRQLKKRLINKILLKGQEEWKGTELEEYCRMLQKELKSDKMDTHYALDVQ